MLRENLGVSTFRSVIREFARRADAEDGVALFYYAGHAVSMDGRNYLLPVDIRPTDEEAIRDDSIDVDDAVMRRLEQSKKQVRLVILDSCRDNPFRSARTRSLRPGLAEMDKGEGSLIAFSTAPGRLAEDGEGQNSLFTGFLVAELRRGNDIESVFQSVRFAVADATNRRQVPWVNTSLLAKVYLRPDTLQPDAGAPVRDASVTPDAAAGTEGGAPDAAADAAADAPVLGTSDASNPVPPSGPSPSSGCHCTLARPTISWAAGLRGPAGASGTTWGVLGLFALGMLRRWKRTQ